MPLSQSSPSWKNRAHPEGGFSAQCKGHGQCKVFVPALRKGLERSDGALRNPEMQIPEDLSFAVGKAQIFHFQNGICRFSRHFILLKCYLIPVYTSFKINFLNREKLCQ